MTVDAPSKIAAADTSIQKTLSCQTFIVSLFTQGMGLQPAMSFC